MKRFVTILLTALLAVPAAQAQGDSVDVNIGRFVEFVDEDTVEGRLTVTCTGTVLEAFAYVVQGQHNSDFGFFNPTCDGVTRGYTVTIQAAAEESFRRGPARVSAFVLLDSGVSDSPSRMVVIR